MCRVRAPKMKQSLKSGYNDCGDCHRSFRERHPLWTSTRILFSIHLKPYSLYLRTHWKCFVWKTVMRNRVSGTHLDSRHLESWGWFCGENRATPWQNGYLDRVPRFPAGGGRRGDCPQGGKGDRISRFPSWGGGR